MTLDDFLAHCVSDCVNARDAAPEARCGCCMEPFGRSLKERKARDLDMCIRCAIDFHRPLHPDDESDLAEQYWTRRYSEA